MYVSSISITQPKIAYAAGSFVGERVHQRAVKPQEKLDKTKKNRAKFKTSQNIEFLLKKIMNDSFCQPTVGHCDGQQLPTAG